MKKRVLLGFLLLISVFFFLFNNIKSVNSDDLAVYVNDELQGSIPKKGEAMFIKSVCDNDGKSSWDNDNWGLLVTNMSKKTKCNLYFYSGDTVFNFDYTGGEQVFTVPVSGTYKLETWGAQGGKGGFGGYSSGMIKLNKLDKLYISVGGSGQSGNGYFTESAYRGLGGWNGGGDGGLGQYYKDNTYWASGFGDGGATSIQNVLIGDGQLKNYKDNIDNIIIVSGGGGGVGHNAGPAGSGGGFSGTSSYTAQYESTIYGGKAIPGNQNSGFAFGQGQTAADKTIGGAFGSEANGGSGGGYYGGFANMSEGDASSDSGSGGSGYIGNHLLKNKVMYCHNCEESNDESTKTISTTCSEETPTEKCSKIGNGYARTTLISIDE